MKTKTELRDHFGEGWQEAFFYCLQVPAGENPYQDASWYISADCAVAQLDDGLFYAASFGSGHPDHTTLLE